MSTSFWKIWVNARSEAKALKVFELALARMNCQARNVAVEPYPKLNGFVICFEVELNSEKWNDRVVEVITTGQRVAIGWILHGYIEIDGSGWSNEVLVSGAVSMQWWLGVRAKN